MTQWAAIALAIIAFAAWVMAVSAAWAMMRHRTPGVSPWWFAVNGIAFFSGRNFEPGAEPFRRRFLRWAGIFFLALLAALILAAVAVPQSPTQA